MEVQEFEKEKIWTPFLGSPLEFIPGQDPLGLLNGLKQKPLFFNY